jgi:hypothetical protein
LGNGLKELAGENGKVAIYLPNTIENLLTSFGISFSRARVDVACAFHGLTSVILPFTTSSQNPPSFPDDVLDILRISAPQVLIVPAGLAIEEIQKYKSIKAIIVVDIASDSHMNWEEENGDIPVKTWKEVLENQHHHDPPEILPSIAIQSFTKSEKGFTSIEFTHQVLSSQIILT